MAEHNDNPWRYPVRLEDLPDHAFTWRTKAAEVENSDEAAANVEQIAGGPIPPRTLALIKRLGGRQFIWPVLYCAVDIEERSETSEWELSHSYTIASRAEKAANHQEWFPCWGGVDLYGVFLSGVNCGMIADREFLDYGEAMGEGLPCPEDVFYDNLYVDWAFEYHFAIGKREEYAILGARSGDMDFVRNYLKDDQDVNSAVGLGNETLLSYAALCNQFEVVQWLLEQGAKPDIRFRVPDSGTATTLLFMVRLGLCCESAELLLEAGADPNTSTHDGNPLFHEYDTEDEREPFASLLRKYGWRG